MPEEIDLIQAHERLVAEFEEDARDHLKVRELNFSRLVAEEGLNYTEAYILAFKPTNANRNSIQQMASRIAGRPRVQAEMARIRKKIKDQEMNKDEHLGVALDGNACRNLLALEFFALGMHPDTKPLIKMRALENLGRMKHVDAFVGSSAAQEGDNQASAGDAAVARGKVIALFKKAISEISAPAIIDVEVAD